MSLRTEKMKMKMMVSDWWNMVTDRDNRYLTGFWATCLVGVLAFSFLLNTRTTSFIGIADSRESIINFEFPVVVQRIHVLSGQYVKQGELIAELTQPDLELRIHQLKSQISHLKAQLQVRQEMTRVTLKMNDEGIDGGSNSRDPLALQISNLERELELVTSRGESLYIFAEISGVIGSVNFKKGESVSPYSPLITISPEFPTYVQGFIYESLHSSVAVGQRMRIVSRTHATKEVFGRVVSVGSRIVPFPVRLSQSPNLQIWGREVMIEIPSSNLFLLGEKVDVQVDRNWVVFSQALANMASIGKSAQSEKPMSGKIPTDMVLNEKQMKQSSLEASGVIYIADFNKYLMISDDTDDDDSPLLYLLNHDGLVDPQPVRVANIDRFEDLESIFQDSNGMIYLMGSQGESKSKKVKKLRNLLVQVERKGMSFHAKKSIVLRPLILEALAKSKDQELKSLAEEAEKSLEIESSGLQDGKLLVGLKRPYDPQGRSLILEIADLNEIMKTETISSEDLRVAYRLSFPVPGQKETWISDFQIVGKMIYFTTISKNPSRTGRVWKFDGANFKQLAEYPTFSPEGITYNPKSNELMVVFDQKDEKPRYDKISL